MELNQTNLSLLNQLSYQLSQLGVALSGVVGFLSVTIALLPYCGRVGWMGFWIQFLIVMALAWVIGFVCHMFFYYTARMPGGLLGLVLACMFCWSYVLAGPDSLRVRAKVSRDVLQYIELVRLPDAKENLLNDWTLADTGRGMYPYEFDRLDYWKEEIRQSWIDSDYSHSEYTFDDDVFQAKWREFITWFDEYGLHAGVGLPPEDLMPRFLGSRGDTTGLYRWNYEKLNFESRLEYELRLLRGSH